MPRSNEIAFLIRSYIHFLCNCWFRWVFFCTWSYRIRIIWNKSIRLIVGTLRTRVELGVISMKRWFKLPASAELEALHQMQFIASFKTLIFWSRILLFCRWCSPCISSSASRLIIVWFFSISFFFFFFFLLRKCSICFIERVFKSFLFGKTRKKLSLKL